MKETKGTSVYDERNVRTGGSEGNELSGNGVLGNLVREVCMVAYKTYIEIFIVDLLCTVSSGRLGHNCKGKDPNLYGESSSGKEADC